MLLPRSVPSVHFFTWGFVCTDISSRNVHSAANRASDIIGNGDKLSGSTWKGGLSYIRKYKPESGLAENVKTLANKPNMNSLDADDKDSVELATCLQRCQEDLSSEGYASVAILASPHDYILPEHRWRSLIAFSRILSLQELEEVAAEFEEIKAIADVATLDQMMLPPNDPLIDVELERQLGIKEKSVQKSQSNQAAERWRKRDRRASSGKVESVYNDIAVTSTLPWLDTLSVRELAALKSVGSKRICDVAQHGEQCTLRSDLDILGCVTEKVEIWDQKWHRKWIPMELCTVQGILLSRAEYLGLEPEFLRKLAGNAYNGPLLVILVLLIWIAEAKKKMSAIDAALGGSDQQTSESSAGTSAAGNSEQPDPEESNSGGEVASSAAGNSDDGDAADAVNMMDWALSFGGLL